jgi:hypothetical protein
MMTLLLKSLNYSQLLSLYYQDYREPSHTLSLSRLSFAKERSKL